MQPQSRQRRLRNARKNALKGNFQTTEQSMANYGNKRLARIAAQMAEQRKG